jgi:Flp pilus assembly secretin CpaC
MANRLSVNRSLAGGLGLIALTALGGAPAIAETMATADLVVQYDQVTLLPLDKPAAEIIVGNPSIAEVGLQSNTMLVITGKTFGVTNLIVLDQDHKQIFNSRLMVKADDHVVTLTRGVGTATYNCTPKCQPTLKIGDDKDQFNLIAAGAAQKTKISESQDAGQPSN